MPNPTDAIISSRPPEDGESLIAVRKKTFRDNFEEYVGSYVDDLWQYIEIATRHLDMRRRHHHRVNAAIMGKKFEDLDQKTNAVQFLPTDIKVDSMVELLAAYYHQAADTFTENAHDHEDLDPFRRGISFDLGHDQQYGDWDAVEALNAAALPLEDDTALAQFGFRVVGERYPRLTPKTRYKFSAMERTERGEVVCAHGARKRPICDLVYTQEGEADPISVQLFRRSEFLVVPYLLGSLISHEYGPLRKSYERKLRSVISLTEQDSQDDKDGLAHLNREVGGLIELALAPGMRQNQFAVLPLGSMYIAHMVHQEGEAKRV